MHEGKHGILDDLEDLESLFGTDDEEECNHKHEHGDSPCKDDHSIHKDKNHDK